MPFSVHRLSRITLPSPLTQTVGLPLPCLAPLFSSRKYLLHPLMISPTTVCQKSKWKKQIDLHVLQMRVAKNRPAMTWQAPEDYTTTALRFSLLYTEIGSPVGVYTTPLALLHFSLHHTSRPSTSKLLARACMSVLLPFSPKPSDRLGMTWQSLETRFDEIKDATTLCVLERASKEAHMRCGGRNTG
jgi:hypothetical protein